MPRAQTCGDIRQGLRDAVADLDDSGNEEIVVIHAGANAEDAVVRIIHGF